MQVYILQWIIQTPIKICMWYLENCARKCVKKSLEAVITFSFDSNSTQFPSKNRNRTNDRQDTTFSTCGQSKTSTSIQLKFCLWTSLAIVAPSSGEVCWRVVIYVYVGIYCMSDKILKFHTPEHYTYEKQNEFLNLEHNVVN